MRMQQGLCSIGEPKGMTLRSPWRHIFKEQNQNNPLKSRTEQPITKQSNNRG